MNTVLRAEAEKIIHTAIQAVQPDEAVWRTLKDYQFNTGRKILVAIGKAAWQMAKAAVDTLGQVDCGIVITKYKHVKGEIPNVECCEAGHPIPDENSFASTKKALEMVKGLQPEDTVIFLVSGGGSCIGIPELIPGRYNKIDGGDDQSNGSYFLTKVRHIFDIDGYKTEFEIKGAKA